VQQIDGGEWTYVIGRCPLLRVHPIEVRRRGHGVICQRRVDYL